MNIHKKWGHRWLTPKAEVRQSPIHEIGTFARKKIAKGETVLVAGGVIVPVKDWRKYESVLGNFGVQISDDFFIRPTSREELEKTGTINHSCNPNLGLSNGLTLITIKNISEGEELATDYAFYEKAFASFKCNCKSKDCRKVIRPTDWKNKALQKKYGKYFSPYLREKF